MQKKRFINLAVHGGCSKKLGANELQDLLSGLTTNKNQNQSNHFCSWLDFGQFNLGEKALISNVDIVLPMVISASDFGEITVAHVLSDIYASGATPLFALNIVGIHKDLESDNRDVVEMINSASRMLNEINVSLVGGHTISQQEDLFYGLAAVGIIDSNKVITNSGAKKGDALVLTKPLGTSIASINWRDDPEQTENFQDVLDGMKKLNNVASKEMLKFEATACTDITGFGFLGHTHNLLLASRASARIEAKKIPIYESVKSFVNQTHTSQIWRANFEYVKDFVDFKVGFSPLLENILFDAQVSGGLLISLPSSKAVDLVDSLTKNGVTASVIGEVSSDDIGKVEIV